MTNNMTIKVAELFAGVGGFRIGLERASSDFKTVFSNQWEPSTKKQDASLIYRARFGDKGHSNEDINLVPTDSIPYHDLMVAGFPCQDYSVAATTNHSGGIEGKKGVLWWQIYRILEEKGEHRPPFLLFENVDRLLSSPAKQRGRDFAIILSSLSDLGYVVEWRVINSADYGMPQRRRRTYILAYRNASFVHGYAIKNGALLSEAFPCHYVESCDVFKISGTLKEVSDNFNKDNKKNLFCDSGVMIDRVVCTSKATPNYNGKYTNLGDIVIDDSLVPEEFFISDEELDRWKYEKGAKRFERESKDGHKYVYSEGAMSFPDSLEKPSRTIITSEGGAAPSRFKHIILSPSGRYRRLTPLELERLNMFPDNHTEYPKVSDSRRAFLMGNALVCGVVERIGKILHKAILNK